MIIQLADYCDRRAEKVFDTLIKSGDGMLENRRTKLVHVLKQCKRVARYQRKQTRM